MLIAFMLEQQRCQTKGGNTLFSISLKQKIFCDFSLPFQTKPGLRM